MKKWDTPISPPPLVGTPQIPHIFQNRCKQVRSLKKTILNFSSFFDFFQKKTSLFRPLKIINNSNYESFFMTHYKIINFSIMVFPKIIRFLENIFEFRKKSN
jgi:hypothetical protein